MRFEFHPDALAEYEEAARHYAACQAELELRFIGAVEHAIRLILDAPDKWGIFEEDIRRCLTRVFPYAMLYTVEPDPILIAVNPDIGGSVLLEIRSATSSNGRIIARPK